MTLTLNFRTLVLAILITLWTLPLNAQTLSKAEKKALKKELRQYKRNPESYKKMIDAKNQLIDTLQTENEDLKAVVKGMKSEQTAMSDSLNALNTKLENLISKTETLIDPRVLPDRTVYQVQVGYYKNIDFQSFNSTVRAVKAEKTGNARRYVIGFFESQADAMALAEDLRLMGISDAFVTEYTKGIRNLKFDAYRK